MQPQTIRLSDDLRRVLDAALAPIEAEPGLSGTKASQAAIVWAEMLSSTADTQGVVPPVKGITLPEKTQKVLAKFHAEHPQGSPLHNEIYNINNALLEMQVGTGHPLIYMEHLPKQGILFFSGLMQLQGNDICERYKRENIPSFRFTEQLHQDAGEWIETKALRGLYCEHPGSPKAPTIFISGEEIVTAMANDNAMRARYGDASAIAQRLHSLKVFSQDAPIHSLLTQNPQPANYPNAPQYILHLPDRSDLVAFGVDDAEILLRDVRKAAASLCDKASAESMVNVKANTAVFWNDRFMLHDRGKERRGKYEAGSRQVATQLATPHYVGSENPSVIGAATAAPCAHVNIPVQAEPVRVTALDSDVSKPAAIS